MLPTLFTLFALVCELLAASSIRSFFPQGSAHKDLRSLSSDLDKSLLTEAPHVRFTKLLTEKIVHAGESFELRCEAVGVPPPIISWTFNGKPLVSHHDDNVIEKLHNVGLKTVQSGITASKIVIPCATKRHTGEYGCVASNAHRRVETTASLTVGARNGSACRASRKHSPPTITMWSDGRFERSDAAAQLYCRSSGVGHTQISWYDEERNLLNYDPQFQVLLNGDLLIRHAKWANLGMYTCVASNEFGEDRTSTFFYPTEPDMKK